MRTRWADYGGWTSPQLWTLISGLDAACFVAGSVALTFGTNLPTAQRLVEGWSLILGAPALLTFFLLRSDAETPTRVGVSAEGLTLVFRKRTVRILWSDLRAPELGQSKSGYFFRFFWVGVTGKRRPLAVDQATAQYILDQPACPGWELSPKLREVLQGRKQGTFEGVKVRFED